MRLPSARSLIVLVFAGFAALTGPACGDDGGGATNEATGPLIAPDGCQPLLAETKLPEGASTPSASSCIAPYPSDFHRAPDPRMLSGFRLGLRGAARPTKPNGEVVDPHDNLPMDGASTIPTLTAGLPGDIVRDGLPGVLEDPTKSARAESPTIIMEADTGQFIAHYTDVVDRKDGAHTPLVLRTFAPLKPKTRYVAAIAGAKALPPSDAASSDPILATAPTGFARLRDRIADPALDTLVSRFETGVFEPLQRAGVARDRLQLAWDFTTGSADEPLRDMLAIRELTLQWIKANDPSPRVVEVKPRQDRLATVLTVEMTAPLFMTKAEPGGSISRNDMGFVSQNGTTTIRVTIAIPKVVLAATTPARAIAYGHGFFGDTNELEGGDTQVIAERLGAILFGTPWWGMSKDDFVGVADALSTRPEHTVDFAERVHQAMANWLVTTAAIKGGAFTKLPELHRNGQIAEPLLYDASFLSFLGVSQGHILGGTLAALDPDFTRVVLNVGGGGFTHMMPRSLNFGPFFVILTASFPDPLLVQEFIAMFQRPIDHMDPITFAPMVLNSPLPGSDPERRVLLQNGLGDAQVPNAGTFLHARALGIGQTMPTPLEVFGIPAATPDAKGALTLFDFHIDTAGYALGQPLGPNDVHGAVRINPKALNEMDAFMKPGGPIIHPCDGACDPE